MKLTTLVANVLDIDESMLSDESSAQNTPNWDSARHIDMLLAVEVAFGVQFSMPEITSMMNLGDMRAVLEKKGTATLAA